MTAYCEKVAKAYSKNPPKQPKLFSKMKLLKRLKPPTLQEFRPRPLPPLISNMVPAYYSASILPIPGENGMKQYCKIAEVNNYEDHPQRQENEKPKWTGLEDILIAYKEYSKGKFSAIKHF